MFSDREMGLGWYDDKWGGVENGSSDGVGLVCAAFLNLVSLTLR